MLVLSRRTNEEIVLPGLEITIKVIRTQGNKVRLGIDAPDSIKIVRGELNWEQSPQPPRTVDRSEQYVA